MKAKLSLLLSTKTIEWIGDELKYWEVSNKKIKNATLFQVQRFYF